MNPDDPHDAHRERHLHHLVQPYVDGELSPEEATAVTELLDRSSEARALAMQQLEVKSLLRTHGGSAATQVDAATSLRVRSRLLAALDDVDRSASEPPWRAAPRGAETSVTESASEAPRTRLAFAMRTMRTSKRVPIENVFQDRVFLRGAAAMIPAAAASIVLFVLASREVPRQLAGPAMAEPSTAELPTSRGSAAPGNPSDEAAPREGGRLVPLRVPSSVELVSWDANPARGGGTVELFDHERGESALARRVDLGALPKGTPPLEGAAWSFRGQVYHLGRDRLGRVVVEFDDAGLRHSLHYVSAERHRAASVGRDSKDPDPTRDEEARALVRLAAALREHR